MALPAAILLPSRLLSPSGEHGVPLALHPAPLPPRRRPPLVLMTACAPDSFPPWEPLPFFRFELLHESRKPGSRARVGRIHTPHGVIDTPGFVPVGTNGALKGITDEQATAAGVQLMFCNTYHLLVHPGPAVVSSAGGLHRYMGRSAPIITDSGGFQVFSLAAPSADDSPELKQKSAKRRGSTQGSVLQVSEDGVRFRSYFNAEEILLTPESSVDAQKALGADIIIPLDELPPYAISRERLAQSVALSHRWMARSLRRHLAARREQAMYSVVHGGVDRGLRAESAAFLGALPFDGTAIGGSLGRDRAEMEALLQFVLPRLPPHKPVHLLGIADPPSVRMGVPLGVDTFDSCFPTRIGRHGSLMTSEGTLHIRSAKYLNDFGPIDPQVPTIDCSRAYLHHLLRAHEPLAATLASLHNVYFMNRLMEDMRRRIFADEL